MALIACFILLQQGRVAHPLCLLFSGARKSAAAFFCVFFFTLLPRVTHAITWNTVKTPWKTHPTQDETENREKAVCPGELTHIWSTPMNIYGRETVMQLVFISQYPVREGGDIYPSATPTTVAGRGAFCQPCREVHLRSSHEGMKERHTVLWTSPTSP